MHDTSEQVGTTTKNNCKLKKSIMQLILRLAIVLASLGGILGGSGAVSPLPFLRSASPVSLDLAPGSSGDFITSFSKQHRTASVDPAAICSGPAELDLNFFNGTPLAAIRTRFEDRGLEGCSWFGEVAGEPPHSSAVVLSLVAGRLAGIVQTRTRGYQILPVTDNTHLVADADMARLSARISALRTDAIPSPNWNVSTYKPEGAAPEDPAFASHILPPGEKRLSRRSMTVDIMVVYTAAALAVFGSAANARAIAQLNVDQTNEAFTRSAVSAQLRLVAVLPIDYEETGDVFVDLDRLKNPSDGYMDNVHALRNTYAADLVGFFIGGKMTFGGLGYLESRKDSAFHLVHSAAAGPIPGYYAMVHEIGHNFGGCHARNTYPNGKPAAGECGGYAFGYQQCQGPESDWWHTIMVSQGLQRAS